ncbi:MAG: hypothetical protein KME16_14240 [Scytolyngbya sp. HA4215-MV1]|nr:hypothetical protein [Scytolyngbya sp. HA4215-MV1]
MLRQDSSSIDSEARLNSYPRSAHKADASGDNLRTGGVDIQRELNRLEEIVLDSPRIPLTRRTVIDEEVLLDQLELIQLNLPEAFHEAQEIVRQREDILLQAQQYAHELMEGAEHQATQIVDESQILRHAELEAMQLRQRVQQECEAIREQAIAEIERLRLQTQQELDEMRRQAIAECEEIQNGADQYADRVLQDMEKQLSDMMRVIRNGRQQLQGEIQPSRTRDPNTNVTAQRPAARSRE